MEPDFTPFEKDIFKQALAAEEKSIKVDKADQQKSWDKISERLGLKGSAGGRGGAGGAGMGDVGIKGLGKKGKLDYKKGGKVSSASKRADGCAIKGKTKGRFV